MKRLPKVKIVVHVNLGIVRKKITYDKCCLHVLPGDKIEWEFHGPNRFAVIVKDFESPIEWSEMVVKKGTRVLEAWVRASAKPGFYSYTICAVDGSDLLMADPEIIVHPPDGRG